MNKRVRRFGLLTILAASLQVVQAQQPAKVPKIGYQSAGSPGEREAAFRQGLRELGYVEGKNVIIEWRFAEGNTDRVARHAAELVRLNVNVIVTGGSLDTKAAREATSTIPIVMTNEGDPVGTGFVAGLSRPGGNVTGVTSLSSELIKKRLELLKEVLPGLSHVFILRGPGIKIPALSRKEAEATAQSLGLDLQFEQAATIHDFDRIFTALKKTRTGALAVVAGPFGAAERKRIVELAAESRLPAIYYRRDFVEDGGLMSYNSNSNDLARRVATYIDKILKGARPADLPVEQPMTFEFIVNLKAAKQIGLTIPRDVLSKADMVIN